MTDLRAPSVQIWFDDLAVIIGNERLPLAEVKADSHIHGALNFLISGRQLPHLGFFSFNDVCAGTWLHELDAMVRAFVSSSECRYVFDEGEQGQPAFVFERAGELAFVSVCDAEYSGGSADPEWQRVECVSEDLIAACLAARKKFEKDLAHGAGREALTWLECLFGVGMRDG